jgi:hypothetical protein
LVQLALLPSPKRRLLELRGDTDEIDRLRQIAADISTLASLTNWDSPDGKFSLFHLLAVATWSNQAVDLPDMYLSRSLAQLFSTTEIKNHHSRPLSNFWVTFAGKSVLQLFKSWNTAANFPLQPELIFTPSAELAAATPTRRSARVAKPSLRRIQAQEDCIVPPSPPPSPVGSEDSLY